MDLEGFIVVAPSACDFADRAPDGASIWVVALFETQPGATGIPHLKECRSVSVPRGGRVVPLRRDPKSQANTIGTFDADPARGSATGNAYPGRRPEVS